MTIPRFRNRDCLPSSGPLQHHHPPGTHAVQPVLHFTLARGALDDFYDSVTFLEPWNGGSGFYRNDNRISLQQIKESNISRLSAFRLSLDVAERALDLEGLPREATPRNEAKNKLLTRLRDLLPDDALGWFDVSILLAGEKEKFPPLLGTSGNDGRLDFSNNFMQCLLDLIDVEIGKATPPTLRLCRHDLSRRSMRHRGWTGVVAGTANQRVTRSPLDPWASSPSMFIRPG